MAESKNMADVWKRVGAVEASLMETEKLLMENNMLLGDMLYARYGNRMGFEKDGSRTRDGKVVWPERMVE